MTVTSIATMKFAVILLTTLLALGCSAGRIGELSKSVQDAQQLGGNIRAVLLAGSTGYSLPSLISHHLFRAKM